MHDLSHEDLAVLHHAGEAPREAAAVLDACPECRVLLEDLRRASRLAARAAASPSPALQARVRASAYEAPVPSAALPLLRRSLALAALCAVAVVLVRWDFSRVGPDDLEGDLARVQVELDSLAESIGHEHSDLDDDIRDLQGDAAALRRQLGG
ncbi:MAG: hypothetical protein FD126_79 [Elusimicrobia bacterium]|nr:MAG: hypothetical protein FD126_79 [Elusimicrobiota bacterium]